MERQNIWQTTNSRCPKSETMEWGFSRHDSQQELRNLIELRL
jgi:hypothetical protein